METQKVKAVVKFTDSAGRIVCLTETNETALVFLKYNQLAPMIGDVVKLERDGTHQRCTDWSLVIS